MNEYNNLCKMITSLIKDKRGKLSQTGLKEKLKNEFNYETSLGILSRLENSCDIKDFELLYWVCKALEINLDEVISIHKKNISSNNLNNLLNEEQIEKFKENEKIKADDLNSDFMKKILPENKPKTKEFLKLWTKFNNLAQETLVPPLFSIITNDAAESSNFISQIFNESLKSDKKNFRTVFYFSSKYKPDFLPQKESVFYYKNNFKLPDLFDETKLTLDDENSVQIIFSENELLNLFSFAETNVNSEEMDHILRTSKKIFYLTNETSPSSFVQFLVYSNSKFGTNIYANIMGDFLDKFTLILSNKQKPENIENFVADFKNSILLHNGIYNIIRIDILKTLKETVLKNTFYFNSSIPQSFDSITQIKKELIQNSILNFQRPLKDLYFKSDNIVKFSLLNLLLKYDFYRVTNFLKIEDLWNEFLSRFKKTFIDEKDLIQKKLDEYFSNKTSEENLEILMEELGIKKIEGTNIIHVKKNNILEIGNRIDSDVISFFIGNLFWVQCASLTEEKCLEPIRQNKDLSYLFEYLELNYKNIVGSIVSHKNFFCNDALKNINGTNKPRTKSLSKKLNSNEADSAKNLWSNYLFYTMIPELSSAFENIKSTDISLIRYLMTNQTAQDDLNKMKKIYAELNRIIKEENDKYFNEFCSQLDNNS